MSAVAHDARASAADPSGRPRFPRLPLLDGLRGLSMLIIFGYHLDGWTATPGGWASVTLFFVVSGFLITALLLSEHAGTGRVSLRSFFARRARRLLPAMLVVTALTTLVALALGGAGTWPTLGGDAISTVTYVSNWRFIATDQSYFASFSPSPLRHTWSLAIEEQFYFLWPLTFVGLLALTGRRRLVVACLAGAAASALWMRHLVAGGADISRAYFGTDTRAQELLIGAALACVVVRPDGTFAPLRRVAAAVRPLWGQIIGGIGLVGLAVIVTRVSIDSATTYTGFGFLAAAICSAMAVLGSTVEPTGLWPRVIGADVLCAIGRRSYSLYLVHWPVIIFLSPPRVDWSPVVLDAVRVAVAFALAEVLHRAVEVPFHTQRWKLRHPVVVAVVATLATLALGAAAMVVGRDGAQGGGAPMSAAPAVVTASTTSSPPEAGTVPARGDVQVAVVGDSQAFVLLETAPDDLGLVVGGAHHAACDVTSDRMFVGDRLDVADEDCAAWPDLWASALASDPDVVVVTLGLRQLFDQEVDGERVAVGTPEWEEAYRADIAHAVEVIRESTAAPIVWLDVPCFRWAEAGDELTDGDRLAAVEEALEAELAEADDVLLAPYAERVCEGEDATTPRDGLRPDGAHLTVDAADDTWRWLDGLIEQVTARPGG